VIIGRDLSEFSRGASARFVQSSDTTIGKQRIFALAWPQDAQVLQVRQPRNAIHGYQHSLLPFRQRPLKTYRCHSPCSNWSRINAAAATINEPN
jgi:hypothetical protein